jgi:hypothetical protein
MTTTLEPSVDEAPVDAVEVQLHEIAAAMVTAADAARGAPAVSESQPERRGFAAWLVYSTCYYGSFGVVLPTLFVAHALPGFGPIAAGLCDGAKAATTSVAARSP